MIKIEGERQFEKIQYYGIIESNGTTGERETEKERNEYTERNAVTKSESRNRESMRTLK